MAKSHLKLVAPTEVNRTVAPTRRPNAELRTREHLTPGEVEALIEAAEANRHGHRDATMILLASGMGFGRRSSFGSAPIELRCVTNMFCAPGRVPMRDAIAPSAEFPPDAQHRPAQDSPTGSAPTLTASTSRSLHSGLQEGRSLLDCLQDSVSVRRCRPN
jgi:hypothetical protein